MVVVAVAAATVEVAAATAAVAAVAATAEEAAEAVEAMAEEVSYSTSERNKISSYDVSLQPCKAMKLILKTNSFDFRQKIFL